MLRGCGRGRLYTPCMRIALFCHKFWPEVGGLCTYTGRLAEYLAARGHDVRVFTTTRSADVESCEHIAPNLVVRRFTTKLANHPPYYFSPGLLTSHGPRSHNDVEVIHTVGYYFFGTVFGHATAAFHGIPHVTTPVYTLNPSTWQRRSFDTLLGRRLVRNAAHVIPQSAHEIALLQAGGFEMRSSTIIPFGVDSVFFEQNHDVRDLRTRHGIASDERVVLFVGKIMSPKGAFDSLAVVARLRAAGRKLRLIMIGEVHAREEDMFAARIRELGLREAIVLLGAVSDRREISRYYQLSDCVLFPSQYEQFGIVALEAAASGRPLIGTPVGIMPTLVSQYECGLLHRFGDLDQFEANLIEVLDAPRFRDSAGRHRQEILLSYDWRSISQQTDEIYHRATTERR
jgi:glycosyltransferase involved in cell wall biosynthesis